MPPEFVSRAADWAADQPTAYARDAGHRRGAADRGRLHRRRPGREPGEPARATTSAGCSTSSHVGAALRQRRAVRRRPGAPGAGPRRAGAGRHGLRQRGRASDEVTFHGEDIEAWIEVPVDGYGWVAVDGTPPEDQLPDPLKQPRSKTENPEPQPPPPTTVPPPTSIPDELDPDQPERRTTTTPAARLPGGSSPSVPRSAVPAVLLGIPARRHRRASSGAGATSGAAPGAPRRSGSPAPSTSWSTSPATPGRPVPPRATRRELSVLVGAPGAAPARDPGRHRRVRPRTSPTDAEVDAAWEELDATRSSLSSPRWTAGTGFRTAVSPTSLRTAAMTARGDPNVHLMLRVESGGTDRATDVVATVEPGHTVDELRARPRRLPRGRRRVVAGAPAHRPGARPGRDAGRGRPRVR